MKTLYLDCFAGISGDMMVGTLIDLGVDPARLEQELRKLPVEGYRLEVKRVDKLGVQATKFQVILTGSQGDQPADAEFQEVEPGAEAADQAGQHTHAHDPHRPLAEILALIERSHLSPPVKKTATKIFTRLGEAEARVHNTSLAEVHFHEVGSVDALVDIVGSAIGLELLGVERVSASALHLGSGFVRCSHGLYPVPAPATANLVAGVPVYSSAAKGELTTPTGAAIITSLAQQFGPLPPMVIDKVGYGAGTRDREFPNVLRGYLGEFVSTPPVPGGVNRAVRTPFPEQHQAPEGQSGYHEGEATVIEANIDDMNPQLFEYLLERLLEAGALDVAMIPVQMKKSRPGTILHVLASPGSVDDLLTIIFSESTTIGARTYTVTKRMLQRETQTVETAWGPVRVKIARLGGRVTNIAPEYEDCRALARQHGIPVKDVYLLARASANFLKS
jgi:uncharacterized protein (TIGR00299 family) protein